MKKCKKAILLLTVALTLLVSCALTVFAYSGVMPKKITRIGKASRTVSVGQEFELKVRVKPAYADDDFLRWEIVSGKKVIRFDDSDRDDDEAEFVALKKGTAKVCCYIRGKKNSTKINFTIKVKKASTSGKTITRVGSEYQEMGIYDDIELEVKKSKGLAENQLEWSIADTSILRFEERKHTGHEMDFESLKAGTTTVTCKIKGTNKKVTFTVRVLPYYDD